MSASSAQHFSQAYSVDSDLLPFHAGTVLGLDVGAQDLGGMGGEISTSLPLKADGVLTFSQIRESDGCTQNSTYERLESIC